MRTATATLVARDLAFAFDRRRVLDGVSLQLFPGQVCALLGPNGAGKSTLIRLLCGRLRPDSGSVRVHDEDPAASAAARRRIGLVPQRLALYPHLDVLENLQTFARLAGLDRAVAADAARHACTTCGFDEVAAQRVGTLSGGWQRRANIACGIVHRPELLILDEPTVGVDLPARLAIEKLLVDLAADGIAVLITSHDLDELGRICDRAAFLDGGRLVAEGAPEALIREAFGDARECVVVLGTEPDAAVAERLRTMGLAPEDPDAPLRWRGLAVREELCQLDDLPALEWQVRRPALDSLWHRMFGRPPERAK
ncbi:ABC transporter ATP-binding protein [Halomonas denitrificans]|nr:ABC transporter ATP-binding protein [Halomonas denitrificans]